MGGGGEDWKRLASHTKNGVFFSGFSSGQGNATGRRKEKWVAKRLDTPVLVCHDILFRVVVSYSTVLVLEYRTAPAQYSTISILNCHAYSATITPAII